MRVRTVAVWAALGMVTMSAGAIALPLPAPPSRATPGGIHDDSLSGTSLATGATKLWDKRDASHFTAGETLAVDARLGHASLGKNARGETFLFASVTGADTPGTDAPPLNLGIVIDRSGSMAGARIANAMAGAVGAVERMREGDSVTVVSFDTVAKVVVPPTRIGASTRSGVVAAIRGIRLGGDTCISCGLETAMRELENQHISPDQINRMILLSDGEPTHGVKDIPGFGAMASRMRDRGFAITTIGVDVHYEERVMAQIAGESNGHHFFVANPAGLPAIFSQEFDSLVASVATEGELMIDLAPSVEVDQVFDRSFRREGQRLFIPFGAFSARQEKTVLMKLRVPADHDGTQQVAQVRMVYRDVVRHTDAHSDGELAVEVKSDGSEQKSLDPFVEARLERTKTALSLDKVNALVGRGDVAGARLVLAQQQKELDNAAAEATTNERAAPAKPTGRALASDFEEQRRIVTAAQANLAPVATTTATGSPPPQASPAAKSAVRSNAADAFDARR